MKSKLFFCLLMPSVFSCSISPNHDLQGNIINLGNDTLFVESHRISHGIEEEPLIDTIVAIDGNFTFNNPYGEPILSIISPKKGFIKTLNQPVFKPFEKSIVVLFDQDEKVVIQGELDEHYLEYTSQGSAFNEDYSKIRSLHSVSSREIVKNELSLDSALYNKAPNTEISNYFKIRKEARGIEENLYLEYIRENPDREVSAFLLLRQQNIDSIGKYHQILDPQLKEGRFKNLLSQQQIKYLSYTKLQKAENDIQKGKTAPDFTLRAIGGEDVSLRSINKRFIVLDFWGSWCAPCITALPRMKEYYNKYNDEIEFVGIACKDKEENWRRAVNKYEIPWVNLFNDHENIEEDVSITYAVMGYPKKILLDADKKIIGIFEGEGEDFYETLDQLMYREDDLVLK